MQIFSLSSVLSVRLSALAIGHRRKHPLNDVPMISGEWVPYASALEFDENLLEDIGLGGGVHRRSRDDLRD